MAGTPLGLPRFLSLQPPMHRFDRKNDQCRDRDCTPPQHVCVPPGRPKIHDCLLPQSTSTTHLEQVMGSAAHCGRQCAHCLLVAPEFSPTRTPRPFSTCASSGFPTVNPTRGYSLVSPFGSPSKVGLRFTRVVSKRLHHLRATSPCCCPCGTFSVLIGRGRSR